MNKIITRFDLIIRKYDLCLPLTLFDENEIDKSRIVECDSKKYYNLTDPPDLVNLSCGTVKYGDWYDDFLLIEK